MPDKNRLTYLFRRYLNNEIADSELEELLEYIKNAKTDDTLKEYVVDVYQKTEADESGKKVDWDTMFSNIVGKSQVKEVEVEVPVKRRYLWRNIAAAVMVLLIGIGGYLYFHSTASVTQEVVKNEKAKQDIMPGGNKAVLTLSNGKKLLLDSNRHGKLAGQGNINVVKVGSGLLAYQNGKPKAQSRKLKAKSMMRYNTLTTPRGGQYQLTLSDGTKVWLNAGSSIRYPVSFNGKERKVEMTGEAYFEVMHNDEKPFKVVVNGEVIEDLGTHFNINAYQEERAMKITLLEGAVKVKNKVLQPGEQALVEDGTMKIRKEEKIDNVVAWKNGYFAFSNANLEAVMRKLARWYDIEVVYKEGIENQSNMQKFSGRIGRDLTLSQILNGLRQTRAHFKIEKDSRTVILQ